METARLLDFLMMDPSQPLALESGDDGWEALN